MSVEIREEPGDRLEQHAAISIAFEAASVLDAIPDGEGHRLVERAVPPFRKDYDAIPDNHPTDWARRFDASGWTLLSAWRDGQRAGGAVMVARAPDVEMLQRHQDMALIWDLRVAPERRREGIGREIFAACERWSLARGLRRLRVETQDSNAAACRFYAAQGCRLELVRRAVYPDFPDEAQLIWAKDLDSRR